MNGKQNLPGLTPAWLISLAMALGCVIVVMIPASIATGDAIKSSDWIGFSGNVVAGAVTVVAAIIAWFAVQRQIEAQEQAQGRAREQQTTDLASMLHAELAHVVARCCFDCESPWKKYWPKNATPGKMGPVKLLKFVPVEPVIYLSTAGQLALLGGAAQHLMEFHYRLSALRREIENTAGSADASTKLVEEGALKLVARRFRETLQPGARALDALAPLARGPIAAEALARALYYEARPHEDLNKTLKQRIDELLLIRIE
ncbi:MULTISPECIES: hypothetical protein [unclassified Bradyrhizobium]|uniref:hypothetical protein n=1 Tax=unclassified Bradyrhizobium TaxID=2631580 RepID=UPI001BAA7448|nr:MULTISPECIES: hypothetical protein [unclassified Bradyrhizobium]MBR1204516.1 hypothetical protein [Bradyrhizobium sp. AUGA SZCCT0124]MBR1309598.1 hypothetical protein [Bradyrhizobium sp. AUGA SZCCT0051]MBR1339739.1 hypothetical protein [Bradyrhizobium sp. AUGA SZCCT0105]MBR1354346.1 hypothetical protein [Bradyrhizobium sp. AUGA SZCCT0045]